MSPELYPRCICQLFRAHLGSTGTIDIVALRELSEREVPLIEIGPYSKQTLTEDGARVVAELIAAFEGVA
jgi:hypothetical protein